MINEINQLNSFEIVYDNETEYSFKKEISSTTTFPEKDFKLSINAGEMYISGNKNIYHEIFLMYFMFDIIADGIDVNEIPIDTSNADVFINY